MSRFKSHRIKILKDFLCKTHSDGYNNPPIAFPTYPTAVEACFGCVWIMTGDMIHWVTRLEYM